MMNIDVRLQIVIIIATMLLTICNNIVTISGKVINMFSVNIEINILAEFMGCTGAGGY